MQRSLVFFNYLVLPLQNSVSVLHYARRHLVFANLAHFIEEFALILLWWNVLWWFVLSALKVEGALSRSFLWCFIWFWIFGGRSIKHVFLLELYLRVVFFSNDCGFTITVLDVDLYIHGLFWGVFLNCNFYVLIIIC